LDPRLEKFVPDDLRDIIARMETWAQEQCLQDKAAKECRADLRRCADGKWENWERLQGQDLDSVTMKFFRSSLMFQHGGLASPSVSIEFMLYPTPRGNNEPLGSYRFSVRLDGYAVGGYLILFPVAEPSAV
jgi:hypothetical protein